MRTDKRKLEIVIAVNNGQIWRRLLGSKYSEAAIVANTVSLPLYRTVVARDSDDEIERKDILTTAIADFRGSLVRLRDELNTMDLA